MSPGATQQLWTACVRPYRRVIGSRGQAGNERARRATSDAKCARNAVYESQVVMRLAQARCHPHATVCKPERGLH